LPLRSRSVDAATAAFGVRNLRPRGEALAELARVLRPGGVLAVLEAAAPRPGWFAPFHRFHLRHVIPLAGRLSDDPSAYQYLSRSIFEFGSGPEFESDLAAAGFELIARRSFLLGATRLWVGRLGGIPDQTWAGGAGRGGASPTGAESPSNREPSLQFAMPEALSRSEMPQPGGSWDSGWRAWRVAQAVVSAAILAALLVAAWVCWRELPNLALPLWQRRGLVTLVGLAIAVFALRTVFLALRAFGSPER
jgi:hypothetical protein